MADSLFICGIDQEAGSSVVTLGLGGVLNRLVQNLAFFKPVGNGAQDVDAAVMKAACNLPDQPEQMCPMTVELAREYVARQRTDEMLATIHQAHQVLRRKHDFVLVEGINNQRSASALDMNINVEIAAHLDTPVLLVARGSCTTPETDVDQLVASVQSAKQAFEEHDAHVVGVVVNRAKDADLDALKQKLAQAFNDAGIAFYGVIPCLAYLGYPKIDQVAKELEADVVTDGEGLNTVATRTIVAAMEPRNMLRYLQTDRTLVIMPGDREDILLAIACTQKSHTRRSVSGVILTGGLRPDEGIVELIHDMHPPAMPILAVAHDTFTTVKKLSEVDVRIRPQDRDKINTALSAFANHAAHEALWEALEMPRPARSRGGSQAFLDQILEKARASGKRVVLPEGDEPRTVRAVGKIVEMKVCPVTLLGDPAAIRTACKDAGVVLNDAVEIVDPAQSPHLDAYVDLVVEARKGKRGGMTPEVARQWLLESTIHFGTLMVKAGHADGLVSGAIHSTGDTIRPALQMIRVNPDMGIVSSVFFMALRDRVLVYGDCAIVPNPDTPELASIAMASARTARAFGIEPRVAMLSYSTGKSGAGESVDKVAEATKLVKERNPDFAIDGPLQYDAAIDPDVGKLKWPDSPVAGKANVFIFPDLDAGNIAYKAVQRSAGALAVGPVLQGLNKPVNDLSRGCSVDDIVYTVAVTAIQAVAG